MPDPMFLSPTVTKREAAIIVAALNSWQKEGAKVSNSAKKIGLDRAVNAVVDFSKELETLKEKFAEQQS